MIVSLAKWFTDGGQFMWAILAVLACAVAIATDRLIFYYYSCRSDGPHVFASIRAALEDKNIEEAKSVLQSNSPLNSLLSVALDSFAAGKPQSEIQEDVEEAAIQEIPRLSQRLNYLSLFANVATLLGLLGTISGLQLSFTSLAAIEASKKATMLASGISQAMITTAFGLIVAVPCMILFTILSNKQQNLTKDLDEMMVKILNIMKKARA